METILSELQKLSFSKMEAKVYISLLQNPNINGYQIAKILKIPRSTVYSCLDKLYEIGAVYLIAGEKNIYQAKDPEDLFENMKQDYIKRTDMVKQSLEKIKVKTEKLQYFNITGYENVRSKVKEIINSSKKEIYLNLGMEIEEFREEIKKACDRGVRIIIFTFSSVDFEGMAVELYRSDRFPQIENKYRTIFLVSDMEKALIANGGDDGEFTGTYSENIFFVSGMASYIHLDIYIHKLEEKFGKDLITEDIKLNTLKEENFLSIIDKKLL